MHPIHVPKEPTSCHIDGLGASAVSSTLQSLFITPEWIPSGKLRVGNRGTGHQCQESTSTQVTGKGAIALPQLWLPATCPSRRLARPAPPQQDASGQAESSFQISYQLCGRGWEVLSFLLLSLLPLPSGPPLRRGQSEAVVPQAHSHLPISLT